MKSTVLIVDDSSTMRKFMAFALEMKNYRVLSAVDGMDALEKLSLNKVDLAVIDLNMPKMDGFELLASIRGAANLSHLPVIILSSEQRYEIRERGLKSGANDYLYKPFDARILQDRVSAHLHDSTNKKGDL